MSDREQWPLELKLKDSEIYLVDIDDLVSDVIDSIEGQRGITVVTGPAGSGKTTLLARCMSDLSERGYSFVLIRGRTEPEFLLKELLLKARDDGHAEAESLFLANTDPESKWNWVIANYLEQAKVVLILDNAEENLGQNGDFVNPKLKAVISMLAAKLKKKPSSLLVSSSMDIEDFDTLELPELSKREFKEKIGELEFLHAIGAGGEEELYRDIGGNPLVMKLLNSLLRFERKGQNGDGVTWENLKSSIPGLKLAVARMRLRSDHLIRLFTIKLLSRLDSAQLKLFRILAAFRFPVGQSALGFHDIEVSDELRASCLETGLMKYDAELERYVLHPAVASIVLDEMVEEERGQLHEVCGGFFAGLADAQGNKSMDDIWEARRHFLEAGNWDAAAETTFSLGDHLGSIGFLDLSFQLLVEISGKSLNTKNRAAADYAMGNLYATYGKLDEAMRSFSSALESWEKMNETDHIPLALQQIGYIHSLENHFDLARDFYNRSLEFYQDSSRELERARLQYQIASVLRAEGDEKKALALFRESVEIMEKSGDEANVAASYLQMGQILLSLKNHQAGIEHLEHSLDICNGMGDISSVGVRRFLIGQARDMAGDVKTGLRDYLEAWKIFAQLAVADEAEVRRYIVKAREKLTESEFHSILEECQCDASDFDSQRLEQEEFLELMRVMTGNAVNFSRLPEEEKARTIDLLNNMIQNADYQASGMESFRLYFQMLLTYIYHDDYLRFRPLLPAEMWAFFERARAGFS